MERGGGTDSCVDNVQINLNKKKLILPTQFRFELFDVNIRCFWEKLGGENGKRG